MDLNEKTNIRLWSVLAAIPVVFGFVAWITYIAYASEKNSGDIKELKESKEAQYKILMDIRTDVAIIKERIKE